jgi:hypothetical protein
MTPIRPARTPQHRQPWRPWRCLPFLPTLPAPSFLPSLAGQPSLIGSLAGTASGGPSRRRTAGCHSQRVRTRDRTVFSIGRVTAAPGGNSRRRCGVQVDPLLLRQAGAVRGYLAVTVGCGLAGAGLIVLQAGLLSRALAGAAHGTGIGVLSGTLAWLGVVVAGRAVAAGGGEAAALRAAAAARRSCPATGPALARRSAGRGDHHACDQGTGRAGSLVCQVPAAAGAGRDRRAGRGDPGGVRGLDLRTDHRGHAAGHPAVRGTGRVAHSGQDPPAVAAAGPARRWSARPGRSSAWTATRLQPGGVDVVMMRHVLAHNGGHE